MTGLAPPWGNDSPPPVPLAVIWTAAKSDIPFRSDEYGRSGSWGSGDG